MAGDDEQMEAAVLSLLLSLPHPFYRTMPELIRELKADRDDVNRALCALAEYGLVEFKGGRTESLRASLAARSSRRLLGVAHPEDEDRNRRYDACVAERGSAGPDDSTALS